MVQCVRKCGWCIEPYITSSVVMFIVSGWLSPQLFNPLWFIGWLLYLSPGLTFEVLRSVHRMPLWVVFGSQNKQWLLSSTTLTDTFYIVDRKRLPFGMNWIYEVNYCL